MRAVIIQTAFLGDVVLALPLAQRLKALDPAGVIGFVVIPPAMDLLKNHPAIDIPLVFDKRGEEAGAAGVLRMARRMRSLAFDIALIPHSSLRSAAVERLSGIPRRIGFDRSAGRWLLSDIVRYVPEDHEVDRNLGLLAPIDSRGQQPLQPRVYPDAADRETVDSLLPSRDPVRRRIALAPGSVWATKRWPESRFAELIGLCREAGHEIVLVGGAADEEVCRRLAQSAVPDRVMDLCGRLTLRQSCEAISRCDVLVTNDSAPMHLAASVGTPVIAIYGATVPAFGFAPRGPLDRIVESQGLKCRPCSAHGGPRCPIRTFECMETIHAARVFEVLEQVIRGVHA